MGGKAGTDEGAQFGVGRDFGGPSAAVLADMGGKAWRLKGLLKPRYIGL